MTQRVQRRDAGTLGKTFWEYVVPGFSRAGMHSIQRRDAGTPGKTFLGF
jgi:hypothetical protein